MTIRQHTLLAAAIAASAGPATDLRAQSNSKPEPQVRLSFGDGRPDAVGREAVNAHLLKIGVRVSEIPVPPEALRLIEPSRHRALTDDEQSQLLEVFSLDRDELLGEIADAGRAPAVNGGGTLSISESNVPPYPKVYDMQALDEPTVAFLMDKFGRLHVNSADTGDGIDEVMTIISGGPYTWFFGLEDHAVAKVRFSEVREGDPAWRISYPGLSVHGGYFDAPHGLVVAHAHGPHTFVMRYEDDTVSGPHLLGDNPWIDFTADPPRLLDRAKDG